MSQEFGQEPAFGELLKQGDVAVTKGGITVRDYFAAAALQGLLAGHDESKYGSVGEDMNVNGNAALAYRLADAMVQERGK
ncbi:MAG TPA: hypothetical protein VG944_13125 [Fimbriimonas sp.]|nr:hypothetical protein [Fimbriimonas sp.]